MASARPTLRSLAAEAGVTAATMSFALRNSAEVSLATRQRLQRLARVRGYRPDPHVAKLMAHLRTKSSLRATANICGLAHEWIPHPMPKGHYRAQLCHGLRVQADLLGYAFSLINLDDYPRPEQLERVLVSRGIEGLLLLPLREPTDLSARLDWRKFSTVSVTSSILAPRFHSILPHHFDNMICACRQLTAAGFRRIGMAMSREWAVRVNHRWTGAITWQNQLGGTEPVTPLIEDRSGPDLDPATLIPWLDRERPDAVVFETLNPAVLEQARRALPKNRRPCIVTMNWPGAVAECGIDQRAERIGNVAIEVLDAMIKRGEKGIPALPNSTLIEGRWIPGKLGRPARPIASRG